jgi:hypothetical protein
MTNWEVYCDETRPELFVAGPAARVNTHAAIGSVWIRGDLRSALKAQVVELRAQHGIWGEAKWTKVTTHSLAFYKELADIVLLGPDVRFRCIVIDATQLDLRRYHEDDPELGFYKFYYQMLQPWLSTDDRYRLFCDRKVNRDTSRLSTLGTVLGNAARGAQIDSIDAVDSHESVLTQVCDVLLGAVQAKFNRSNMGSQAKAMLLAHIEHRLGHQLGATTAGEQSFNIFKIRLNSGGTEWVR